MSTPTTPFTTSFGREISANVMARVGAELAADRDWQDVATRILRPLLPAHEDDLSEVNEILAEAETRTEYGKDGVEVTAEVRA